MSATFQWAGRGWERDPRIPPLGRLVSAELEELEDGEYAIKTETASIAVPSLAFGEVSRSRVSAS
jgi:hypothetical protein